MTTYSGKKIRKKYVKCALKEILNSLKFGKGDILVVNSMRIENVIQTNVPGFSSQIIFENERKSKKWPRKTRSP